MSTRRIGVLFGFAVGCWLFAASAMAAKHEFEIVIEEAVIEVAPNLKYKVFAFNGQVPGPLIRVKEGDDLTVHVINNTSLAHTIHWHGIYQKDNWRNDGVPAVTQVAIEPGESFTYEFRADKPGTLWYHCHVNVNEHVGVRGMWGPLIVDPKKPTRLEKKVTREAIMMLSSWESVYAEKFGEGGGPKDLADYFSINGRSFPLTQPIRLKEGDVLRVRFIGAGKEIHAMHSHGHDMLVTHKDGLPLPEPYAVDTLMIGPGERYDVIMTADNPGRFIFHDHVDPHVTNGGKYPGGAITIVEYEGVARDDSWYVWKDKKYEPDFFFGESLMKGYGLFEQPVFKGELLDSRDRRRRR